MGHGLETGGRHAERKLDGPAKRCCFGAEVGDIDEDARAETILVEGGAVLMDGDLVGGAGVVEV